MSISSAAGTPASRSPSPALDEEPEMPDTSGPISPTPFAFYDPDSHSWRTSQGTFPWDSVKSSPIFRRGDSAFTRDDGETWDLADTDELVGTTTSPRDRQRETICRSGPVERAERCVGLLGGTWPAEPDVGRVADGVPYRVDRLRSLGNSVVPQVAEFVGRQLLTALESVA